MLPGTDHSIELKQGILSDLNQPVFFHAADGTPGKARTNVQLLVRDGRLIAGFECLDDPYQHFNTYKEHNTDLWRQEVFEIFIAGGGDVPSRYLELEINPHNALFAAWVDNISGQGPEKLTMLGHDAHGIRHEVTRTEDNRWEGRIDIPLSLLAPEGTDVFRINFYRIVLHSEPASPDWECDTSNCDFLCWSPTLSGEVPAFHRPRYFGTLRILP